MKLWGVVKRTVKEFGNDNLTDWAAALTYYGVLSIFPGMLVMVSIFGMLGQSATQPLIDELGAIAPGPARDLLTQGAHGLQGSGGASVVFIVGLATALWAASGYVGAFIRASNVVYDVPEGRPFWKTKPLQLLLTVIVGVLLAICALMVVFTGPAAEWVGGQLGFGGTAVSVWNIAKWPALVLLVSLVFGLLYWAAPNARTGRFRLISAGSLLAVVIWIVASAGFGVYAANFGSYDKTYGTLGGVIVFFVWLWISNIAVLLGLEFDAELRRAKAVDEGLRPKDAEPFVELRDESKLDDGEKAAVAGVSYGDEDRDARGRDEQGRTGHRIERQVDRQADGRGEGHHDTPGATAARRGE
ncbi:YihY/virulence factor BrkB family protein [Phytomonospora sp. NPDC050363]|uniref:YihY/virulence factor BrkB family protein n=1 Tax=Phytomonospora sp. NPDC050363 TaxID=3155642 RepID=UPI0033C5CED4